MNSLIFGIDFDGTCVTHEFPEVGKNIGAATVLRMLCENGHKLILYTMRSDRPESTANNNPEIQDVTGMFLQEAVKWFSENNIPLYGIQHNPNQGWTTSPKCYAHLYIDDAALGAPLKFDSTLSNRPFIDWKVVEILLREKSIII